MSTMAATSPFTSRTAHRSASASSTGPTNLRFSAMPRSTHDDPVRGIATSGWRGRSFSLGIADAVTVLGEECQRRRCRRDHHRQ